MGEKAKISLPGQGEKETAIDIGGGGGEYFVKMARENPNKRFLILEPKEVAIENKPENLEIIYWKSDVDSDVPLKESSVDEAHVNFLMGEIQSKEPRAKLTEEDSIKRDLNIYRKLLRDLKVVLKKGAIVEIADVQFNINFIIQALKDEGYEITSGPEKLKDKDLTTWSSIFSKITKKSGWLEEDSNTLPVVLRAIK